jgi:hypothetical protein
MSNYSNYSILIMSFQIGQLYFEGHYVRDIPPYGHAPTYEISLTYLETQKILVIYGQQEVGN